MKTQRSKWLAGLSMGFLAGTLLAAPFEPLFRVMNPKGPCQARRPGDAAFDNVQKGKAYPYGTTVRCGAGASALIVLSSRDAIQLDANTTVEIVDATDQPEFKVIRLRTGKIDTHLDSSNPTGAIVVETPIAYCTTLTGNGKFKFTETETGFTFDAQAEASGTAKVVGPQFIVPMLKSGYGVRIVTARDNSLTRIENLLGDYRILVNKGAIADFPELAEGEVNDDLLVVDTSTHASVKIWRAHAPVGGRLIVSVLATDSNGKGKETFAFAVGQPNIASRAVFEDAAETNAPAGDSPARQPEADAAQTDPFATPEPAAVDAIF